MTNSNRGTGIKSYSAWEWIRGYLVLALWLPFFPLLWFLNGRTLPAGITRKLLRAHNRYTASRPMDFRIPPDTSVPAYMDRWWRVPRNWATNIYFHIVKRSDDDRALHDHPWFNISIVLDGGYFEHTIAEGGINVKTWHGPGSVTFRWTGRKAHRLELCRASTVLVGPGGVIEVPTLEEMPATTIFVTGPVLRRWGFHHPSGWVDAYQWDDFCAKFGIEGMKMNGGSDAVVSDRNRI